MTSNLFLKIRKITGLIKHIIALLIFNHKIKLITMTVVEKMKIEMIRDKNPIVTISSFYSNSSYASTNKPYI